MEILFWLQLAGCVFMAGLIWTIQLVHYPAFEWIDRARFADFERFHSRRISWIVLPVMSLELVSALAVALLGARIGDRVLGRDVLTLAALALLIGIWAATAAFSVPCHHALERDFDERVWRRLVATNWIRTGAWTLRAALLFAAAWGVTIG